MKIQRPSTTAYEIRIKNGFKPKIDLSYRFIEMSNTDVKIIDRGFNQDFYSCEVVLYERESVLDAIISYIDGFRSDDNPVFILSEVNEGEKIFGENVDYSLDNIEMNIIDINKRQNKKLGTYSLSLTFVADTSTLTFISYAGSWPSIPCVNYGQKADLSWTYDIIHSYDTTPYLQDRYRDIPLFEGYAIVNKQTMSELREFYRNQRGETFPILTVADLGVAKPFGPRGGSFPFPDCRIVDIKEEYYSPTQYKVQIILTNIRYA